MSNGIKQGCVLAPTLFSFYLATMLEVAFADVDEGIYIQTRHDADLFNVAHFKAKTKTSQIVVREMLFADDSAIAAHDAQDIQQLVDRFAQAAEHFSFKINIKKTECLYQPVKNISVPLIPTEIKIKYESLVQCKDFVYLSSTMSENAKLESELAYRIGYASTAFGKQQDTLWKNHHVSIRAKDKVYRATVLSSVLYGAETWTIYRTQVKRLHAYMTRHLRQIMAIQWEDKVSNIDVLKHAGLPPMADQIS